jgi:hypothetical protein
VSSVKRVARITFKKKERIEKRKMNKRIKKGGRKKINMAEKKNRKKPSFVKALINESGT